MKLDYPSLKKYIKSIRAKDPQLSAEIDMLVRRKHKPDWLAPSCNALTRITDTATTNADEIVATGPVGLSTMEEESIVLRYGRPVIAIKDGTTFFDPKDIDSDTWRTRLSASAKQLQPAIASVGRIEVTNHPSGFPYMGTGWVIDRGVVVTNRHVALTFAQRDGIEFSFLLGFDRKNPIGVDIDFLEEIDNSAQRAFPITRVLYISRDNEPDFAFLAIDDRTPAAIPLLDSPISAQTMVAVIGYPAKDSRIPDQELMNRIFGGLYDKKRLSPGFTDNMQGGNLPHDCTTLGGCSGAPVIDLLTGKVCGLHFSGSFLKTNYAVPAATLDAARTLARSGNMSTTTSNISFSTKAPSTEHSEDHLMSLPDEEEIRITVPLEISIRLGKILTKSNSITTQIDAGARSSARGDIQEAVAEAQRLFAARTDVMAIEAGWKFVNGWITDTRAVVVAVRSKMSASQLEMAGVRSLPESVLGVPLDVRVASIGDINPALDLEGYSRVWTSPYQSWPEVPLNIVDEKMKITLHTSPDAGWPQLKTFLNDTQSSLTIGMYDFTAPHIVDAVVAAAQPAQRKLSLVLQSGQDIGKGTKKDDYTDQQTVDELKAAAKTRFSFAWASVHGAGALFRSAYHIKVAVRDDESFWLSSGNWQSSNQPNGDPLNGEDTSPTLLSTCNREWHAIVENKTLASMFERYLKRDREQAAALADIEATALPEPMIWVSEAYFQPTDAELESRTQYFKPLVLSKTLKVQPLLTPDNYSEHVVALIESAKEKIFFQNQSLKIGPKGENAPHYEPLLAALLKKQEAGLDVRIIIRRIGDLRATISAIKDYGFDMNTIHLQTNCHTKGIIVDGETVMLGSQNWTGDGTGYNRDASLIIYAPEAAQFFEQIFLYDWNRTGKPKIDESLPAPQLVTDDELTPPPRMIQIPLRRWMGES
jgi:hypothetical protein